MSAPVAAEPVTPPDDAVESYGTLALRFWAQSNGTHWQGHACLTCADGRAMLGLPPLATDLEILGRKVRP